MNEEKEHASQKTERELFSRFLEKTAEEVRGWPAWKQAILGVPQAGSKGASSKGSGDASEQQK